VNKNRLFILTGPASVGKTTVARVIAANAKELTAIVDGDDVAKFNCYNDNCRHLFWVNANSLINNFLEHKIDVVFSHAITYEEAQEYLHITKEIDEIKFVFLTCDEKTLRLRNQTRTMEDQANIKVLEDLDYFNNLKIDEKFVLDTSKLSLSQTAKNILEEERFIVK
jgi:guanylate kinase